MYSIRLVCACIFMYTLAMKWNNVLNQIYPHIYLYIYITKYIHMSIQMYDPWCVNLRWPHVLLHVFTLTRTHTKVCDRFVHVPRVTILIAFLLLMWFWVNVSALGSSSWCIDAFVVWSIRQGRWCVRQIISWTASRSPRGFLCSTTTWLLRTITINVPHKYIIAHMSIAGCVFIKRCPTRCVSRCACARTVDWTDISLRRPQHVLHNVRCCNRYTHCWPDCPENASTLIARGTTSCWVPRHCVPFMLWIVARTPCVLRLSRTHTMPDYFAVRSTHYAVFRCSAAPHYHQHITDVNTRAASDDMRRVVLVRRLFARAHPEAARYSRWLLRVILGASNTKRVYTKYIYKYV